MSALKGITGEVAEALHVADVPQADMAVVGKAVIASLEREVQARSKS
jgi:hypothetical protein